MLRITSELWPQEVHPNVFDKEEKKVIKQTNDDLIDVERIQISAVAARCLMLELH